MANLCIDNQSPTGLTHSRISHEFELDKNSIATVIGSSLLTQMETSFSTRYSLSEDDKVNCSIVKELLDCIYRLSECPLPCSEMKNVIDYVTYT